MKKLKKIMLVDDDFINNYINEKLLNKLELAEQVVVLKNGKEGLDFLKENSEGVCPELIFLDNQMPVMDGVEFMENLKKINFRNFKEVVVMLLVATVNDSDIEKYKELGVNEFTSKPLSEKVILDTVNKYWGINQPQAMRK